MLSTKILRKDCVSEGPELEYAIFTVCETESVKTGRHGKLPEDLLH